MYLHRKIITDNGYNIKVFGLNQYFEQKFLILISRLNLFWTCKQEHWMLTMARMTTALIQYGRNSF